MTDLNVVLQVMAMAMVQAMERASQTGTPLTVTFVVDAQGRIAPVMKENWNAWTGAYQSEGGTVGEFRP